MTEQLTFSKRSLLWSIPVRMAMIRNLYWITFSSVIIFQSKKAYKHILIADKNSLKGIKSAQKRYLNCNQSFSKSSSTSVLWIDRTSSFQRSAGTFRNHEEGLKELHQFHESWILPKPSHFRLVAKVTAKDLSQAYMVYEYVCLNYFFKKRKKRTEDAQKT